MSRRVSPVSHPAPVGAAGPVSAAGRDRSSRRGRWGIARSLGSLLAVLVAVAVAGCRATGEATSGPLPTLTVTVVATDWNGWNSDDQPAPITRSARAAQGGELRLRAVTGVVVLTITAVGADNIELRTSSRMAPESDGGGMDLKNLQDRFTITTGSPVVFHTPTLDAGTGFTVTVTGS